MMDSTEELVNPYLQKNSRSWVGWYSLTNGRFDSVTIFSEDCQLCLRPFNFALPNSSCPSPMWQCQQNLSPQGCGPQ